MKERPIIFNSWSIPRILDGSKTMTRRTRGLNKFNENPDDWGVIQQPMHWSFYHLHNLDDSGHYIPYNIRCHYGQAGDRLLIKEPWATENQYNHLKPSEVPRTAKIWYLADEEYNPQIMGRVRSSMFMCNWMGRTRLEITDTKAERLQDISFEGAKAEGCISISDFAILWDSLNAKRGYGWNKNPWCRVVSFKKLKQEGN